MRCYNSRKWGVVRASVSEYARRYGRLLVLLQNLVEALATELHRGGSLRRLHMTRCQGDAKAAIDSSG